MFISCVIFSVIFWFDCNVFSMLFFITKLYVFVWLCNKIKYVAFQRNWLPSNNKIKLQAISISYLGIFLIRNILGEDLVSCSTLHFLITVERVFFAPGFFLRFSENEVFAQCYFHDFRFICSLSWKTQKYNGCQKNPFYIIVIHVIKSYLANEPMSSIRCNAQL